MGIKEEIGKSFREGTTLTKLIYINLGVFVLIGLTSSILGLFNVPTEWTHLLMLPAGFEAWLQTPWTIITYMFFHTGFIHILFNVLMLFWFGRIFLQFFSQKDLVGLYIMGGIAGGALYMISYYIFPVFSGQLGNSFLLGASASIMAIMIGMAVTAPNYSVQLVFIGKIPLKWIAVVSVILSLLNVASVNAGGEISHLGGAFAGYVFAAQHRKGHNITSGLNRFLDAIVNLFKRKPKLKVTHQRPLSDKEYNFRKKQENDAIDRILEKIKKGGYESLSKEEKQTLFQFSQK